MTWKGQRKRKKEASKAVAYRMPSEQLKRLRKFVADNDTTQAAVFREALDAFMEANPSRRRRKVGADLFD